MWINSIPMRKMPPWKPDVPEGMAHGDYRLAIYFDGNGGKVDPGEIRLHAAGSKDRRPPFLGAFPTSGIYFFPKKKPAETELGGGSIFAGIF